MYPASVWLALMLATAPATHAGTPADPGGHYRLRICRGACNADSLIAEGSLVLLTDALRDVDGMPIQAGGVAVANGCFDITRLKPHGRSMLARTGPGYTAWSIEPGSGVLRFDLVPDGIDAFYPVELRAAAGGYVGQGRSVYANEPGTIMPVDLVTIERIGDATPAMCANHAPSATMPGPPWQVPGASQQ
jgi:hypothetical protein